LITDTTESAKSSPYKHSAISDPIDDKLLRSVRDEIRNNVSFTPKETNIYKSHDPKQVIHQGGTQHSSKDNQRAITGNVYGTVVGVFPNEMISIFDILLIFPGKQIIHNHPTPPYRGKHLFQTTLVI
jgi:hypothetical protein